MGTTSLRWKTRTAVAVAALASVAAIATAAPAGAAEIVGEATVTLDFTTPGSVQVDVFTKNLSTVPAIGTATVTDPDGVLHPFSIHHYGAGEVWTYSITLFGYTCADLGKVTAQAYGTDLDTPTIFEWTSGVVKTPDSRVTVIGCSVSDPEDPEEPVDPVDPETPVVVPAGPATTPAGPATVPAGPATTPAATGGTATPAATTGNVLPASQTDGALWATPAAQPASGIGALAGLAPFTIGLGALAALGAAGAVAARRR